MPIKLTTKPPDATADKSAENKPAENKFDPFRPEMPKIPGVSESARHEKRFSFGADTQRLLQIGGIVTAVVLISAIIIWQVKNNLGRITEPKPNTEVSEQATIPPLPLDTHSPIHDGPTVAATVDELSKPWTAKKFTFIKPITQEKIDAMVIRLPNAGLWAFALQGPASRCDLEFVTDVATLAAKYRYNASHPMVVNPCDGTVYDPLKVGAVGGDTWVRGEIVQGSSLRPPISIDVKVSGRSIIADRIE